MTARAGMAALITRLRLLINDANSTPQLFTDDELQDILDANSQKFDQAEMIPIETVNATTKEYEYLTYTMYIGPWEASPTIQDADFATITPSASDLIRARWALSTSKTPPLYITGAAYDLYAAAAQALGLLAAKRMIGYDELGPARFNRARSADIAAIHAQAEQYRKLAWPYVLTVRP